MRSIRIITITLRRTLFIFCLLLAILSAIPQTVLANTPLQLSEQSSEVYLLEGVGELFHASDNALPAPLPLDASFSVQDFVRGLTPAENVDQVAGGSYWLHLKLDNPTDRSAWVLTPFNAIIDTVQAYIYTADGVEKVTTGYLHPDRFSLHYGIDFQIQPQQQAELLILIQSRYFSGQPRFEIVPEKAFISDVATENTWILACLGAILILGCYNLFIGIWMRDRSYLYYALYLLVSVVGWSAGFGLWGELFSMHSYGLLIPPFFLNISFNILYFIHFLQLPKSHPRLTRFSYALALFSGIFTFTLPFFSPGLHLVLLSLASTTWIITGLYAGIVCWREGYQPARFFVLAFALIFLGALATIIPNLGFPPVFKNSFLATLIAQTFDILLLSLALADRINLLRTEKQAALEQLLTSEQHKAKIEREAKAVLAQANEKLQQSLENAELESERKSNFLRMVSHELRTPLHSISSSIDQWSEVQSGEQQDEIFKDINYGAVRLCTQVDNLVLMAETDDSKLEAENHPFELRPVIDKLHSNILSLIDAEKVSLEYRCAPNLPRAFSGDAYLISHLVRTVLDNACKYTKRGEILFAIDWNDETQMLGITVKDDGCGMSKEQQKVVFQGFVQVSRGLTRQSEGLGLGLTLCHRLSEVLNATLSITSELGEGSQIDFQIPLKPLPAEKILPRSSDFKGSILIVEDNLINAKVLERIIVKLGHPVNVAHSGLEALAAVGKQRYSVILMDVQMPDMDGITVTQKIRAQGISSPIIAVTANSDADVRRKCRLAGMNDITIKPVKLKDIQQLLLEWQQVTTPPTGQAVH